VECEETSWLDNEDFLKQFNKKVGRRRVPLSGNIDLTHRCNLGCVHCYIGEQSKVRANRGNELNTTQWQKIIDEITEAGTLFFLITGGEPLMRKDFAEIYRHAKMNGLLVTIFSNGTLIDGKILDLFSELPPRAIEISLYGASQQTYERITGVKGSFKKCLTALENLKERHINLRLKTMLMSLNRHEFSDIENMAKAYESKFRFDAALFPTLTGDKSPIDLRVSAEDAIGIELSDDGRLKDWQEFYEKMSNLSAANSLYRCGAGQTYYHIDPYGNLQPCMMVTNLKYNLLEGNFSTGWNEAMTRLRDRKPGPGYRCNTCEKRMLCGFCPGFSNLENGSETAYSEYLCKMGQLRYEKINEANQKTKRLLKEAR
jgi:radical SAM protein with 4Fe4S-binding SPASM domain